MKKDIVTFVELKVYWDQRTAEDCVQEADRYGTGHEEAPGDPLQGRGAGLSGHPEAGQW